jgi:hypothetical protein
MLSGLEETETLRVARSMHVRRTDKLSAEASKYEVVEVPAAVAASLCVLPTRSARMQYLRHAESFWNNFTHREPPASLHFDRRVFMATDEKGLRQESRSYNCTVLFNDAGLDTAAPRCVACLARADGVSRRRR